MDSIKLIPVFLSGAAELMKTVVKQNNFLAADYVDGYTVF